MDTTANAKISHVHHAKKPEATQNFADNFNRRENIPDALNLPDEFTLLTYGDVSKILGRCQKTIENICRVRKEIPLVYVGNKPMVRLSDLKAYIAAGGSPAPQ